MMNYDLWRTVLFRMPPELAHFVALSILKYTPAQLFAKPKPNPIKALGLTFPHALGLAAGLDKNGDYIEALYKLGFAFIEVGTVTPKPQAGNPKPRLFRVVEDEALINQMGFNNKGVDYLVANLKRWPRSGIIGVNIGKNKTTSLNQAADDYVYCLEKVYPYASYITLNISSPNTPELRQLQQPHYLNALLTTITKACQKLNAKHQRELPLLIKVSPDETPETLKHLSDIALKNGIAGLIATNTTNTRPLSSASASKSKAGGLSGKPITDKATQTLKLLHQLVGHELTLIGVGGIHDAASAYQKLEAGAQLLQLYTSLIYKGPQLISKLTHAL